MSLKVAFIHLWPKVRERHMEMFRMETPFFLAILVGEQLNRPSEKKPRSGKAPGPESPAEAAFVCTFLITAVLYMQLHSQYVHWKFCIHRDGATFTTLCNRSLGRLKCKHSGPPVLKSCSGPPAADFGSVWSPQKARKF